MAGSITGPANNKSYHENYYPPSCRHRCSLPVELRLYPMHHLLCPKRLHQAMLQSCCRQRHEVRHLRCNAHQESNVILKEGHHNPKSNRRLQSLRFFRFAEGRGILCGRSVNSGTEGGQGGG